MVRHLLIIVLAVALFLRVVDLSTNPPGFFCDEVSVGYNAYLVAHTGKDEWHNSFPLFFKSFGEYRNPLEVYATIPAVYLHGVNAFTVRIISVLFSITAIVILFLIGSVWSPWLGIMLAAIMAVTPWSVHMGRTGFVAENIYLFCITLSLYFIIQAKYRKKYILLFFLSCGIGIYSYFSAYVIYPILVIASIVFLWKKGNKQYLFIGILLFYILSLPLGMHIWKGNGATRFNQVSLLKSNMNPGIKFVKSYMLHFSPAYLFIEGDKGAIQRHGLLRVGELYLWELPGLLLGVYYLIKRKTGVGLLVGFLFLIYPIPSSITADVMPLPTRSIMGLVPFTFVIGYGCYELLVTCRKYKNKYNYYVLMVAFTGMFIISVFSTLHLLDTYGKETGGYMGWQYGMEDSIKYLNAYKTEYDALNITHRFNSPEELLLFFNRTYHCDSCRIISNPIVIDRYHKELYSIRKEDIEEAYSQYEDVKFIRLKTIRDPGGTPQLFIGYFIFTSTYSGK